MNLFESMLQSYEFNRSRTLSTLDRIEALDDPGAALGWQPADGRAHVAWQIMHVAITEDIFASERLAPSKPGLYTDLWCRFRGGSTPDHDLPEISVIRNVLDKCRSTLLETLGQLTEDDLETIPAALKERHLTVRNVLHIISWHESHHQGQAHITLNLFENQ